MIFSSREAIYSHACAYLSQHPIWASLITEIGPCKHEAKPEREPYEALIRAIAYQQISAKAGDAILRRLRSAFHTDAISFPLPQQLIDVDLDILRQCGFSARKAETLKAIAQGAMSGQVPSRVAATGYSDEELIAKLTALKGIGRWTVEMLLIYTLERIDIMPLDDFGIQQGLHYLHAPSSKLSKGQLKAFSEICAPYRTIAAWYLWRIPQLPDYLAFKANRAVVT
ncbi:DNA-3-methyladenine glycosylase family protein [Rouxiella sp. Mn2063]|uniref:DNA-3-methyladenine glycosylase family protein n=1 Tax=Rouxiella sp. Mn2063 TaxID=3395262 RepID=UPI003BC577BA